MSSCLLGSRALWAPAGHRRAPGHPDSFQGNQPRNALCSSTEQFLFLNDTLPAMPAPDGAPQRPHLPVAGSHSGSPRAGSAAWPGTSRGRRPFQLGNSSTRSRQHLVQPSAWPHDMLSRRRLGHDHHPCLYCPKGIP